MAADKHASSAVIERCIREADRTDKQDVRVPDHPVQYRREFGLLHLERVKLLAHMHARNRLQRLDQLACVLAPRRSQVSRGLSGADIWRGGSGDDEEGCWFEQNGLGRAAGLGERYQVPGQ
jgi:hypothetical protein